MSESLKSGPIPTASSIGWSEPWVVGTPEQFRWIYRLLQVILILNLIDAVLTLFWVGTGLAIEANVILQAIVTNHPVAFMAAKVALVSLGAWLLWQRRQHPLAIVGLVAAFVVYYALMLHHLRFASWVAAILLF